MWIATPQIVEEYREVLRRPKFSLANAALELWEESLRAGIAVVDSVPEISWPDDPDDAIFVGCAVAVDADFLVTDDRGLLAACSVGSTLVVTVSQFMQLTGRSQSR